jgi:predicted Zn-dependent protease
MRSRALQVDMNSVQDGTVNPVVVRVEQIAAWYGQAFALQSEAEVPAALKTLAQLRPR